MIIKLTNNDAVMAVIKGEEIAVLMDGVIILSGDTVEKETLKVKIAKHPDSGLRDSALANLSELIHRAIIDAAPVLHCLDELVQGVVDDNLDLFDEQEEVIKTEAYTFAMANKKIVKSLEGRGVIAHIDNIRIDIVCYGGKVDQVYFNSFDVELEYMLKKEEIKYCLTPEEVKDKFESYIMESLENRECNFDNVSFFTIVECFIKNILNEFVKKVNIEEDESNDDPETRAKKAVEEFVDQLADSIGISKEMLNDIFKD